MADNIIPFPQRGGGHVDLPDNLKARGGVIAINVSPEGAWRVAILWGAWPTPINEVLFGTFGSKAEALAEAECINGALPERLPIDRRQYLMREIDNTLGEADAAAARVARTMTQIEHLRLDGPDDGPEAA